MTDSCRGKRREFNLLDDYMGTIPGEWIDKHSIVQEDFFVGHTISDKTLNGDIGFERFEEVFQADPNTMLIIPGIKNKPIKIVYEDDVEAVKDKNDIKTRKKLSGIEAENLLNDVFGTTDIGVLNCIGMTDEKIDIIIDKWNNIPEVIPIEDWKKLGYTDEEAERLARASKIYK